MSEKKNFRRFDRGVELGVAGAHRATVQVASAARQNIGQAVDELIKSMRDLGLEVDACDGAFKLEAAMYEWLRKANPAHPGFALAEQLGRQAETGAIAVEQLLAAAWSAEDRLGVLIECDNEDHGGAAEDDLAAFHKLRAALKPFGPRDEKNATPVAVDLTPFEQFVASGREVSDLSKFVPDVVRGQEGILYDAGLYIERDELGCLYLRLGNQEFAEVPVANQRRLEAILYEWSVADGTRKDVSKEQSAASEAAHYICGFTTIESRTRATLAQLQELTPGVCHVQDIADAWTILDKVAAEGTNLDLAYELMRGLLALE